MKAHEALGCQPSFTCAPYQTEFRPRPGEQIAWGESNAIVFANSVIGARTNRYGDFIDLCCAITGRAPAWGLHLDEQRRGQVLFRLVGFPDSQPWTDSLAVGMGLVVGARSGERIPVVEGLPVADPRTIEDYLKALGAAAASSGAVALFHAVGITPEAPTLADALAGRAAEETIEIRPADVAHALQQLSTVPDGAPISAVCLGTPHFSRSEWDRLLPMLRAASRSAVPIYVNTGRAILADLEREGALPDPESVEPRRGHRHLHVPHADSCAARRHRDDQLRQVGVLRPGEPRRSGRVRRDRGLSRVGGCRTCRADFHVRPVGLSGRLENYELRSSNYERGCRV